MMASSSDWLFALSDRECGNATTAPDWLKAPSGGEDFVECMPFAGIPVEPVEPEVFPSDHPVEGNPPAAEPKAPAADPVEEAFARGEEAGRVAALEEFEARQTQDDSHHRAIRLTFAQLDSAAMDALATDLARTVRDLCHSAITGYEPDAESLTRRCKEAAARIGAAAAQCTLHLNPSDIALIDAEIAGQWRITPDEGVERGGLRFESVDGSIEDGPAQWRRAIASALRGADVRSANGRA